MHTCVHAQYICSYTTDTHARIAIYMGICLYMCVCLYVCIYAGEQKLNIITEANTISRNKNSCMPIEHSASSLLFILHRRNEKNVKLDTCV